MMRYCAPKALLVPLGFALVCHMTEYNIARATCASDNVSIVVHNVAAFQVPGMPISLIQSAANKMGCGALSLFVNGSCNTEIPPANVESIRLNTSGFKTIVISSHGGAGAFVSEFYSTKAFRDARWETLDELGYDLTSHVFKTTIDWPQGESGQAWGIGVTPSGIAGKLTPTMDPQAIVIGSYCCGAEGAESWGADAYNTRSFAGYSGPITFEQTMYPSLATLFNNMGCLVEESSVTFGGAADKCELEDFGNKTNRLNCSVGCDLLPSVREVVFDGETVLWQVSGERRGDLYKILGRSRRGGAWDLVATAKVSADTEPYAIQTRRVDLSADLDAIMLESRGINAVTTRSGEIRADRIASGLMHESVDRLVSDRIGDRILGSHGLRAPLMLDPEALVDGSSRGGAELEGGGDQLTPPCQECGDLLIYSSDPGLADQAEAHFESYAAYGPYQLRAKVVVGSADPLEARLGLQNLIAANLDWNESLPEPDRQFPVDPMLVIAGSLAMVHPLNFADDNMGTCQLPTCASYYDIADLDNDGVPDCPVQVMPAENSWELGRMIIAADDWSAGRFLEPSDVMLMYCSDVTPLLVVLPQESVDCEAIRAMYESHGRRTYLPLVESEMREQLSFHDRRQLGIDMINAGVRDLWIQGAYTKIGRMSDFAWGNDDSQGNGYPAAALTRKQRMMVYAPGCFTAADRIGYSFHDNVPLRWLTNDPEKTMAAGIVGNLDSNWDINHHLWRHALAEAILSAPAGKPIGRVVYEAVRALPVEMRRYGRGIVVYGGYVKVRHDAVAAGLGEATAHTKPVLMGPNPAREEVKVSLGGAATTGATVQLLDVLGREVRREVVSGKPDVIVSLTSRDGRRLASGVYFVRVEGAGRVTMLPIVAVH
ncbi:MAG: T9SS type A sorting domain-containing protein [Candidatus Eisenbacteria bacterium]|nr:T9SS type A sorting domain-containing protein [Candidatus Eisenbacteria bacterium]